VCVCMSGGMCEHVCVHVCVHNKFLNSLKFHVLSKDPHAWKFGNLPSSNTTFATKSTIKSIAIVRINQQVECSR
jgi:hypothetical protein